MATSLLYVPTNRRCTGQMPDLVAEARLIGGEGRSCTLAIIEHADAPWSGEHLAALARSREVSGIDALHVTFEGAAGFLAAVVGRLGLATKHAARLLALLNPVDLAYGAGPNKAALLAASLGADVLHRRDSDVRADHWPKGPAYPCVPEVEALGRRIGDLLPAHAGKHADQIIHFAGTSSFGHAPHDRRDLMAAGERFVIDLEVLAAPEEPRDVLRREMQEYLVVDPGLRYTDDFFELDRSGRTVMLACAMSEVFLELPEMPIPRMLGTDYMRRNLLRHLGRPIVFHSRKVRHRYDDDRAGQADLEAVVDYARRDLRHLVIWPILTRHHRVIARSPEAFVDGDGRVDRSRYAANLVQARDGLLAELAGIPAAFASTYRQAASVVSDRLLRARLDAVAEAVESGPDFVGEVATGIDDYCFLIDHWKALVDAARDNAPAMEGLFV